MSAATLIFLSDALESSKRNGIYGGMLKMINSRITNDLTFSANDMMQIGILSNTIGEARSVRDNSVGFSYLRKGGCLSFLYHFIVHDVQLCFLLFCFVRAFSMATG